MGGLKSPNHAQVLERREVELRNELATLTRQQQVHHLTSPGITCHHLDSVGIT